MLSTSFRKNKPAVSHLDDRQLRIQESGWNKTGIGNLEDNKGVPKFNLVHFESSGVNMFYIPTFISHIIRINIRDED